MKPAPMADDALTRKEAEVGRLTREEIVQWREWSEQGQALEFRKLLAYKFQTLCNLALRALSLESVREGAAEKDALAKRLVAYYAEWAPRMRGDEYEAGDWRWLAIHLRDIAAASITELSPELEERKQAAIRALQHAPARVGEGERVLFDSDSFCPACGHDRDRSSVATIALDDGRKQCQMCDIRWTETQPPESPAKEQPGEQDVGGVSHDWHERADDPGTYDCETCGSWTANLPLYKDEVCDAKERRFSERRKPLPLPPERP